MPDMWNLERDSGEVGLEKLGARIDLGIDSF